MVRKLAAALLGVGVLVPGLVQALGLGGIKLNSALSEPLDAEIELVQTRELTPEEILPSMASNADFDSAGVEKYHFLNDMKFDVVLNANGRSFIKVTSRKPMKEPFVNFLVEVHWPDGRLLREYTILLDPPVYRAQAAPDIRRPATSAPVTATKGSTTPAVTQRPVAGVSSGATTPSANAQSATAANGTYGPTGPSDSLWGIAAQMRPSRQVNVHQTMLAIQQLNPDAFLNGNINLLRRGQILRAPTEADASSINAQDAIRMVAEQNRAWRERAVTPSTAKAAPIDTSGKQVNNAPARVEGEEGKLTLVSPSKTASTSTTSAQGGEASSGGGVLRDKLALAEESTDKFKLENEDLKLKLNDLQEQSDTSNQVLKLKDDQIAALQAKMAELQVQLEQLQKQTGAPAIATTPAAVSPTTEKPAEPSATSATGAEAQAVPSAVTDAAVTSPVTESPVDANSPSPVESKPAPDASVSAEGAAPSEQPGAADVDYNYEATPEKPKAEAVQDVKHPQLVTTDKPIVATKPVPVKTLAEEILSNWFYLLGIAGVGALGVVGATLSRRKKGSSSELDDVQLRDFSLPVQNAEHVEDLDLPEAGEETLVSPASEHREETVAQTADVIGEADIYIAYGRFNQAIEMLERAAAKEPARNDIRLKLLEVAVEAGDVDVFDKHSDAIVNSGDRSAIGKVDALRGKLPTHGNVMDAVVPVAAASAAASAAAVVEDDVEDDMPDLDFESSIDFSKPTEAPQTTVPVGGLDFSLDFDLSESDARDVPAQAKVPEPEPLHENSLDFDLEFDLEKDFVNEPADTNAPAIDGDEDQPALEFESQFSLDETASADIDEVDTIDHGLELELEEVGSVAENFDQNAPLDFEIVESEQDTSFTAQADVLLEDDDVRHAMDFEQEELIDSSSAAMLADELDFDDEPVASPFMHESAESEAPSLSLRLDDVPLEEPAAPTANVINLTSAIVARRETEESEDLDFITDGDEASTKLDLARAYIDMGDREGAKDILDEVLLEGNTDQQREAKELLARLE